MVSGSTNASGLNLLKHEICMESISTLNLQARKCHGCLITNEKMYVVGGTSSQRSVMTSEYLDLSRPLTLQPLSDDKLKTVETTEESIWTEIPNGLPSWHNSSSGLLKIGQKLVALSVYGSDHDKYFDLDSR